MGADQFFSEQSAKTAEEAFQILVAEARYEDGNEGYTGTIAEKSSFDFAERHANEKPKECVQRCLDDDDHWSADKWGPAACVDAGPDPKVPGNRLFWFFGWAPS